MNQSHDVVKLILKECIGCGVCVEFCPKNAIPQSLIGYISTIAEIDIEKCNECGDCVKVCSYGAIKIIKRK